jgi:uncharacterized BrkB/YihY/UPF0761 family membrane protein
MPFLLWWWWTAMVIMMCNENRAVLRREGNVVWVNFDRGRN